MNTDAFAGTVIMVVCCWGCAALFSGIGLWAKHSLKPVNFYSGTSVDPKTISDISAYNRANGRMWMLYSLPFWMAGAFSLFIGRANWCAIAALCLITLACVPGLFLLVRAYKRICGQYMIR